MNLDEAKIIKDQLEAEELNIETNFASIRADIYVIISENNQRNQAQELNRSQDIPALLPGGASALETDPEVTPPVTKLPYFVNRPELVS